MRYLPHQPNRAAALDPFSVKVQRRPRPAIEQPPMEHPAQCIPQSLLVERR